MDPNIQPIRNAIAVTLDAATPFRSLYIGSAGNVAITNIDGTSVTFTALAVGAWHPIEGKKVNTTGTTVTTANILICPK